MHIVQRPGNDYCLILDGLKKNYRGGLEEADLERFRVRYEELTRTAREALGRGELLPAPRKSGRIR